MATPSVQFRPAERLVFFTDAVVAIMTLLILPLLESVTDAAKDGLDTAGYLREHDGQLFAFALSLIIAAFWRSHDRLFVHVERQDPVLLWLNVGWMFTIVWLPVATALVGAMETEPTQLAIYIGTMLATSLLNPRAPGLAASPPSPHGRGQSRAGGGHHLDGGGVRPLRSRPAAGPRCAWPGVPGAAGAPAEPTAGSSTRAARQGLRVFPDVGGAVYGPPGTPHKAVRHPLR